MMSKGPRLRAVIGAELKRRRVIARRQSPRSWVTRLRARASGVSHRDYGGALVVPDTLGRAQGRSRRPLLRRGAYAAAWSSRSRARCTCPAWQSARRRPGDPAQQELTGI